MGSSSLRKIASHYLLTRQGFSKHPLVTIDTTTRRVVAIEHYDPALLDSMAGVEFYDGILCAGMVNAHAHLELSYLKGAIEERSGLAGFAAAMGRVRNNFSAAEREEAIVAADRKMWEEGVEAVADIVNDESTFATKRISPIAYRSMVEIFGLRESNIERQRRVLTHPDTRLTPHSIYSVREADFREACRTTSTLPLSIHFLESEAERQLFEGCGALHEWYAKVGFECDFLHHGSPARRIVASIPQQQSVMLVHNCALTEEDIDIIMGHFTAPVFWVLCPRSNRYISGITPQSISLMRARGLNICIGTDSLASNHSLSLIDEIREFGDLPLAQMLGWLTHVGARALGLDAELGTVEVGRRCGIVNICGVDMEQMRLTEHSVARRIV